MADRRRIIIAILLAANALAMIFTYGHAFVAIEREELARCAKRHAGWVCDTGVESFVGGLACAALWPLYWSVQLAREAGHG